MSIILFLIVLFVLVLVHEFGHFIVAKWSKMRVDEFGIGFPPKIFGVKKGETEYTLNALPIGGFVKIFGEDGLTSKESSESDSDTSRSFMAQSRWKQAAVLVAGVAMNVLFAWLLMIIVFVMGVNTPVTESEASPDARLTITDVLEDSPASDALIEPGSVIQSAQIGEQKLENLSPTAFSDFIGANDGEPVIISYTYSGELKVVQLLPRDDIIEGEEPRPAIGVALTQIDTIERSILESTKEASVYVVTGLRDITIGISKLIWDSLRFNADFSQIAGPVGIVGLVGEASSYGITTLLMFTAFISLNLAIINILPFPALDGGRLLIVAIEAVIRRPIKPEFVGGLNAIGFILLILLMVAVTWNDIARII